MIGNIDSFHPYFDDMILFLDKLLDELPFSKNLNDAVKSAQLQAENSDNQLMIMFPDGHNDILNSLIDYINIQTTQHTHRLQSAGVKGVKALLKELILYQIKFKPHMSESFRKISAYNVGFFKGADSIKRHFSLVDNLWYCVNDTSTDFNYWSKRGLLAKIYFDCWIYALSDKSKDYKQTEEFLVRSFNTINLVEKIKSYLPNIDQFEEKIAVALAKIRYKK